MHYNFSLLKELCGIHAPSGNELAMKNFILDYVKNNATRWKVQPEIIEGEDFQDAIILSFGHPKVAVFAHIDSIGFTVGYHNDLIRIGGPVIHDGIQLTGKDSKGIIDGEIVYDEEPGNAVIEFDRMIDRGTDLVFKPLWNEDEESVQCCYMDNRLGVWTALQLAETMENGLLVFSTYEEHQGGSVGFLTAYMYQRWKIKQALICDITWITEGVRAHEGVAISMRDRGIPRRSFLNKIIAHAKVSGIPFQLEVESAGSSDGGYIQTSPYPVDWCFIGAPEDYVHSPREKVSKKDIDSMVQMYRYLIKKLHE
jgi:putative aminopeptidase FrvX